MKIKTLQFELWQNCNNNCDFCYLDKNRIISSKNDKINNIKRAKEIIENEICNFNGIGLIGRRIFSRSIKWL